MIYNRRRFVPVVRDFPEGCGVSSLIKSKFKSRRTVQAHRDLPDLSRIEEDDSNHSETGTSCVIQGLDNANDDESVDSNVSVEDHHQEKEVIGEESQEDNTQNQVLEWSTTVRKTSSEKKRRLSLGNSSTMEVESEDVVNASKRVLVSGLAAESKSPWRQPRHQGSKRLR